MGVQWHHIFGAKHRRLHHIEVVYIFLSLFSVMVPLTAQIGVSNSDVGDTAAEVTPSAAQLAFTAASSVLFTSLADEETLGLTQSGTAVGITSSPLQQSMPMPAQQSSFSASFSVDVTESQSEEMLLPSLSFSLAVASSVVSIGVTSSVLSPPSSSIVQDVLTSEGLVSLTSQSQQPSSVQIVPTSSAVALEPSSVASETLSIFPSTSDSSTSVEASSELSLPPSSTAVPSAFTSTPGETSTPVETSTPGETSTSIVTSTPIVMSTPIVTASTTPSEPTVFLPHTIILVIIGSSGGLVIALLLLVVIGVLSCCCFAVYRRCTKSKRTHHLQRSNSFYETVTDHPVSGGMCYSQTAVVSMNDLNLVEMGRLRASYDPLSQLTPRGARYIGNGVLSASDPRMDKSHLKSAPSQLTSTFYPTMKETSLQGSIPGLLTSKKNAPIFGPTEDFNEGSQVEQSLTQESLTNSLTERQLPKRTEIIHADIKVDKLKGEQEYLVTRKEEPQESNQDETIDEEKPIAKSLPATGTITTLSKKEASMIDLSMITMIKNSHFEDEEGKEENPRSVSSSKLAPLQDTPSEGAQRRRHTSADLSSNLDKSYETDTMRNRRMKALDLGALTSLAFPTIKSSTENLIESPDDGSGKKAKRKDSLARRQSRSMANLSYGGEADDEDDDKPAKAAASGNRPSSAKPRLPRASSMLEELTCIGSPSKVQPIEPVKEADAASMSNLTDCPSDSSSARLKEPARLKSILKNPANRPFSHSQMELHHEPYDSLAVVGLVGGGGGYSPGSMPRHMYSPRKQPAPLAPPEEKPRIPVAVLAVTRDGLRRPTSAYASDSSTHSPLHRAPSYDMSSASASIGHHYPNGNHHHHTQPQPPPPVAELDGNEQFWGRSMYKYYDSDISSPDYQSSKRTNRFGAY